MDDLTRAIIRVEIDRAVCALKTRLAHELQEAYLALNGNGAADSYVDVDMALDRIRRARKMIK
jgi:hypothetical protein